MLEVGLKYENLVSKPLESDDSVILYLKIIRRKMSRRKLTHLLLHKRRRTLLLLLFSELKICKKLLLIENSKILTSLKQTLNTNRARLMSLTEIKLLYGKVENCDISKLSNQFEMTGKSLKNQLIRHIRKI
jgi:hypothetical protein